MKGGRRASEREARGWGRVAGRAVPRGCGRLEPEGGREERPPAEAAPRVTGARGAGAGGGRGEGGPGERGEPGGASEEAARETRAGGRGAPGRREGPPHPKLSRGSSPPSSRTPGLWLVPMHCPPQDSSLGDPLHGGGCTPLACLLTLFLSWHQGWQTKREQPPPSVSLWASCPAQGLAWGNTRSVPPLKASRVDPKEPPFLSGKEVLGTSTSILPSGEACGGSREEKVRQKRPEVTVCTASPLPRVPP